MRTDIKLNTVKSLSLKVLLLLFMLVVLVLGTLNKLYH